MYFSERLASDRHAERLEQAQRQRVARHAAELRKLDRVRQRAERDLLRTCARTDRLHDLLESTS